MASQNTSSIISQVYTSRNVLVELLKSQNYNTMDYENFSVSEINVMKTNNQLDMILEQNATKKDTRTKKIYVKYYLGKLLRPSNLQEMIDDLFVVEEILTKEDTLLVVVKDDLNDTLINTIKHIWETENIFIILQPLQRLQFNILNHTLVSPHRILDDAEKIMIKHKYNIMHDEEFPELSRFDPVAQAIGIRPGQVCEIIRPSKTAITSLYYRICI